ncbi:lipid phosphatase, partial [Branchiostoma belcheri]
MERRTPAERDEYTHNAPAFAQSPALGLSKCYAKGRSFSPSRTSDRKTYFSLKAHSRSWLCFVWREIRYVVYVSSAVRERFETQLYRCSHTELESEVAVHLCLSLYIPKTTVRDRLESQKSDDVVQRTQHALADADLIVVGAARALSRSPHRGFPCVVLGGVGALMYFLQFTNFFPPVKQGFYCNDRDYSKPYVQTETIPPLIMYGVAVGLPTIVEAVYVRAHRPSLNRDGGGHKLSGTYDPLLRSRVSDVTFQECTGHFVNKVDGVNRIFGIILGETFLMIFQKASTNPDPPERTIRSGKCHVTSWMRRVFRFIGVHLFGACSTVVLANVLQMMSGRLTPYFLTVCLPDYSQVRCQDNPFVTTDICTGTNQTILQARKSFPNMPTALGGYATVYLAWYLQVTLRVSGTRLLKPLLVLGAAGAALANAMIQVADYRCHLTDAAVGLALGAAVATYLVFAIVNCFKPFRSRDELLQFLDTDSDVTSTISPSTLTPSKPLALPRPSVRQPHNDSNHDVSNSNVNDWRKGVTNDRRPLRSEENYITRTTS